MDPKSRPIVTRMRPRTLIEAEFEKREVTAMERLGVVESSRSEYPCDALFVPKKGNQMRYVCDLRPVNARILRDQLRLPMLYALVETVARWKAVILLDLMAAFWQLPLDEATSELFAFHTVRGTYHYRRMPFGYKNASAEMQRVTEELIGSDPCRVCFIDDIALGATERTKDPEMAAIANLDRLLHKMEKLNLTCQVEKCTFFPLEVNLLGYQIKGNRIRPHPERLRKLLAMEPPYDKLGLQRVAAVFREFIPRYADLTLLLTEALKKNAMGAQQDVQKAHKKLLEAVATLTALTPYDEEAHMIVETDASEVAASGVIWQQRPGSKELQPL
ncbi:MAG: uncharacterized protein KVP18_002991, partial [Porospora cf. gigantea A]